MSNFNELYCILYKNGDVVKTVMNEQGGIMLFLSFNTASKYCENVNNESAMVHRIEISKELFK